MSTTAAAGSGGSVAGARTVSVLEQEVDRARAVGDMSEVKRLSERLLQQEVPSMVAFGYSLQAQLHIIGGELSEAKQKLEQSLEKHDSCMDALYLSASVSMTESKQDNREHALEMLKKIQFESESQFWSTEAKQKIPYMWSMLCHALYLKGELCCSFGDPEQALASFLSVWQMNTGTSEIPIFMLKVVSKSVEKIAQLYVELRQPAKAITFFRKLLLHSTHSFPAILESHIRKEFARLLSRCITEDSYTCPEATASNIYVPQSTFDEAVLLLLVEETKHLERIKETHLLFERQGTFHAVQESHHVDDDVILTKRFSSQQAVFSLGGFTSNKGDVDIGNEISRGIESDIEGSLTITFGRAREFDSLCKIYRRALSTEMENASLWFKLSLALMSSGKYWEAFLAIQQCIDRDGTHTEAFLIGAKLCMNHISRAKLAVQYAQQALQLEKQKPVTNRRLLATCHLVHGISAGKWAYQVGTFTERKKLQKQAFNSLNKAYKLTPENPKVVFHLALIHADIREIQAARKLVKQALELDRSDSATWVLLALILSSKKQLQEAVMACDSGLQECPRSLRLLLCKARILTHAGDYDQAVSCFSTIVDRVFDLSDPEANETIPEESSSATSERSTYASYARYMVYRMKKGVRKQILRRRPVFRQKVWGSVESDGGLPDMDALSLAPTSTGTVSGIDSHFNCDIPKEGTIVSNANKVDEMDKMNDPRSLECEVLLSLSDLYAVMIEEETDEAERDTLLRDAFDCVFEARKVGSSAYLADIHAQMGLLCVRCGQIRDAIRHLESALAIDSKHVISLVGMAIIESKRESGNLVLSQGYLTSALHVDGTAHEAWHEMGAVLQAQGKHESAADHFLTSLQLERTSPAVPFSKIKRQIP